MVEGKHDIYLMYLNDEEITENETWIGALQEEYHEASAVYADQETERKLIQEREQEELNRQHMMKLREEEFQRIVQQTIMKKKSTETIFEAHLEHAENLIRSNAEDKNTVVALRKAERDIERALADCKSVHAKVIDILDQASAEMKSNGFEESIHVTTKQSKELEGLPARQSAKITPNKTLPCAWKRSRCRFSTEQCDSIRSLNKISKNR